MTGFRLNILIWNIQRVLFLKKNIDMGFIISINNISVDFDKSFKGGAISVAMAHKIGKIDFPNRVIYKYV